MTETMANPTAAKISSGGRTSVHRARWRLALVEMLLIFAVFVLQGGTLVPEVNEPNYLAKAKHYWNPDWCPVDFFLNSADTHLVFYWTFGWLSQWLSLPALAWTGRLLTWGLLAVAWQRLSSAIAPRPLYSVLSAGLLVLLNERFHMAGEWLIGGVEAKGFAYAALFMGLAAIVRNRWRRAWIWLGIASAFHVLVGGWGVIAAGIAWCCAGRSRPKLIDMIPSLFLGLLLALPGIGAALSAAGVAEPELVDRAARIQVFHRLPHHLNPAKFWFAGRFTTPVIGEFGLRFTLMTVAFLALAWRLRRRARNRRLIGFVLGSLAIAIVGAVWALTTLHNESLSAWLLRYYWFRLSDVAVPLGLALLAAAGVIRLRRRRPRVGDAVLLVLVVLAAAHLVAEFAGRYGDRIPPADTKLVETQEEYADWVDICEAASRTGVESKFLLPMHAVTFKWYAGRSEVVNWKEMPQNATATCEWWERVRDVHRGPDGWRRSLTELSPRRLRALGGKYRAHYVLTEAEPRLDLILVYRNNSFAIYQLADQPAQGRAAQPGDNASEP